MGMPAYAIESPEGLRQIDLGLGLVMSTLQCRQHVDVIVIFD
jgi:hypothetical protein